MFCFSLSEDQVRDQDLDQELSPAQSGSVFQVLVCELVK